MKILGIETSCDETAVAVLDITKNKIRVLSNTISSQVKLHAKFGGVVPNLAAREHVKNINRVFKLALKQAGIKSFDKEIDLMAVTRGPGLGPALLVGLSFAKTLAWKYNKPIVSVNHLEGHVYSNWLPEAGQLTNLQAYKLFPILNLLVSGGHTELVLMKSHSEFELIGETFDDAVGEAFDKVARLLGLGYPGGPIVSKMAESGNPNRYPLPSPMIHSKDFNFSYSGLKTAVLYLTRDIGKLNLKTKKDICASFQKAAMAVLIKKTFKAVKKYGVDSIMLSGGVSANTMLRSEFKKLADDNGLKYSRPQLIYTTDNAAMIAMAGYMNYKYKKSPTSWEMIEMDPNLGF